MIHPRLLSVPSFAKATLTTAVTARDGTGATLLYTVPATYDFAAPPAFSSTSGWVVSNSTTQARVQGARINRIRAIARGASAEGQLLIFHGSDLVDQAWLQSVATVTAVTATAQAELAFAEGWLLPPGAEIRVGATAVTTPITVTLEGLLG